MKKYDSLRDIQAGSYDWKVKARIIRLWRGITKTGEEFKTFNMVLLDDKNSWVQAFVTAAVAKKMESIIELGRIYSFQNFTVKDFKPDEKFRCIHRDKQIILTSYTEVKLIEEENTLIESNMFDFYELGDLHQVAYQSLYLTDVVGVIECVEPLIRFVNKNGQQQLQKKFTITDGRSNIRVTFWDISAEKFEQAINNVIEHPPIIIIAAAKVASWKDQIQISNVTATHFFLNYNHHSVVNLRRLLTQPIFSQHVFSTNKDAEPIFYTLENIKNLDKEYIEKAVISQVKIISVEETGNWYISVCTSCYKQIFMVGGKYPCVRCNRNVPFPDKKFKIFTTATDETGGMDLILEDRAVRTIIGKDVFEVETEEMEVLSFPSILHNLAHREYAVKILVREANINNKSSAYVATDMFEITKVVPNINGQLQGQQQQMTENYSVAENSNSEYHLDDLSQLNFKSPEVQKKTKEKV